MARTKRTTRQELKEDKFVEYTLRAYDFVKNNVRLVIAIVAAVVVLVGAFAIYQYQKEKKGAEASLAFGKALELFNKAEEEWNDPEKTGASKEKFQQAKDKFQTICNEYASTNYGDEAFFYNAKCAYVLRKYEDTIGNFEKVVEKYPDTLVALFSQLAIGKCYEQKGELKKAVSAYDSGNFNKFRGKFPQYGYVIAQATFRQAQCYERVNQIDNAAENYGIIINQFEDLLRAMVDKKSGEFLKYAQKLATSFEGLDVPTAEEIKDNYFALVTYTDAIRQYKIEDDLSQSSRLSEELSKQIKEYEKRAEEFIKSIKSAKRHESVGNMSSALYSYDRAVGLNFPPGRKLYEEAKLQLDLLNKAQKRL